MKLLVEELPDISDTRTFKDALIKASNIPDNDGAFMYYLLSSRINSEEDSLMIAAYDNQILPKINPQKTNCVLYVPFDALLQDSSSNAFEQNLSETEWYRALTTRKALILAFFYAHTYRSKRSFICYLDFIRPS